MILDYLFYFACSVKNKEVCNGGVACSLLQLGSLEKTVIATVVCTQALFFVEKMKPYVMLE